MKRHFLGVDNKKTIYLSAFTQEKMVWVQLTNRDSYVTFKHYICWSMYLKKKSFLE